MKIIHIRLFFILTILSIVSHGFGQGTSPDEAKQYFEKGHYEKALPLFKKLVEENRNNPDYNYYYGISLVKQRKNYTEAVESLGIAVSRRSNRDARYYRGIAFQHLYEFEKAIEEFNKFLDYASEEDPRRAKAQRAIDDCKSGEDLINKHFQISVLEKDTVREDSLLSAYELPEEAGHLDHNRSFFKTGVPPENIMYRTEKKDEVFFVLEEADSAIHDIYKMELLLDSWSESKNLGTPVNSDYDDRTPFLMTDGTTFYFASDRPGGMGGLDIYHTIYDPESNSFSEPENLGPPFSSPADDYLFAADPFTEKAWFTTNRGAEPGKVVVATIKWDNSVIKNLTDSLEQITLAAQLPVKEDTIPAKETDATESSDYSNQPASDRPAQFTFHVSDTIVYTHYNDFRSQAALAEFKRGRSAESKTDSLEQLMRHKREEYARSYNQEKLNTLIDEILELEKTVYGHNDQAKRHYARARQMEQEKIAQLVKEGKYRNSKKQSQNTHHTESSFSNIPNRGKYTFYTDEDFKERREKLSGMYQKFFKPHQIQTLQRTDSMYTWANIMKLEASRVLEETAEEGSADEKSLLERFKNIDSLVDSEQPQDSRQLQKEASHIREQALNLYHEALDTKYSIYLPVLKKMANLTENRSVQNTIRKAQSYFEEADKGVKTMQTWNPEHYERLGSIKREAINLMEKELLNMPASPATSLSDASDNTVEGPEANQRKTADYQADNTPRESEKEENPDTLVQSAFGNSNQTQKQENTQSQKPVYKIQIGVFRNQPDENALASIPEVSSEEVENAQTTRYFSGEWKSYNDAKQHVREIRNQGFPGAFVVAFLNGEQIPLSKAREMSNKE